MGSDKSAPGNVERIQIVSLYINGRHMENASNTVITYILPITRFKLNLKKIKMYYLFYEYCSIFSLFL